MGRSVGRARGPARARGGHPPRRHPVRPSVPAAESRRAEHRPARVGDDPRRRSRPALVRLPDAGHVPARAVPGVAARAVVPDGAGSCWSRSRSAGSRPRGGWDGAAYGPVAGFVAASAVVVETTYVAYSRMAVTDVPLTVGVTVALALMVSGRIELAGLAVGLAASAKYPGIILLAPLVAAGVGEMETPRDRRRARGGRLRGHEPVRADRLPAGRRGRVARRSLGAHAAGSASRTTTRRRSRSPGGSGTASGRRS